MIRRAVVGLLVVATVVSFVVPPVAGAAASHGTPAATSTVSGEFVTASSDRRVTGAQATVFQGERNVDITGLDGTNPAGTSQRFYGLGGAAEGRVATVDDTRRVNVTTANGFVTGTYNLSSSDGIPDVVVREPLVSGLSVFVGPSATGVDVTNQSVPSGTERLTVDASFNFAAAENVTVTVEDENGLDITEQLTSSPTITAPGETLTLAVGDLDVGQYTVTAEGAEDLDAASETVTVRVRDPEKSVTLSRTHVVRGDATVASVAGAPGDVRYLRISGDDLDDGLVNPATARDVFDRTSQVQSISADSDANYLYAVVAVDDDGISEARIRTGRLTTGPVDVELAPAVAAAAEDDVTLDVTERTVTVDATSATPVGETRSLSGTAPQSDWVKLYAEVDGQYHPLYEDAASGALAEVEVRGTGAWRVDVDTSAVVDIPGTYRLVAVGDPGGDRLGSTETLDSETLRTLDPRGSMTLTTTTGALSLATSRTTIAATGDDEFTLSGVATGGHDDLRLYHVGPRGTVDADNIATDDGRFEERIDGVERRGSHTYLVVAPGRDGSYAYAPDDGPSADGLLSGSETPDAARAKLVDAYTGAGSDDNLARVVVTAAAASITLSTPQAGETVTATSLPVAGRTNSEDGTTVFVELTDETDVVSSAETHVRNGSWNATLNLSGAAPGTYQLRVDGTTAEATRTVTVASGAAATATSTSTPQETPRPTAESTTTESEATPMSTTADSATGTTSTQFPGFAAVTTGIALVLAVLVAARAGRSGSRRGRR